jgi:phospholipid/cholesterol/gamma-HCH transport system substrate-binding protein
MRDDKRNYVVVGVFVTAMVVALITWILKVGGGAGPSDDYSVVFDNVSGLKTGVEILYEGYPVGLIEKLEPIDRDGRRRFRINVSVRRGWPIPSDSRATVTSGLFSAPVINIEGGDSSQMLPPGSEIPALHAQDVFAVVNSAASRVITVLDPIADKVPVVMKDLERLGTELNVAVDSINAMLAPENAQRVTSILRNIDGLTGDANELLAGLGGTRRRLDRLIAKVDGLLEEDTGDVAEAMAELNQSLAAVSRHIDAISANLEVTTRNFSEFSKHIRDDPSLLIRGREGQDGG